MNVQPGSQHASDALQPGAHCRIGEAEWFHFLQVREPLHQWGGAFLHAEGPEPSDLVRVYLRDDSRRGVFMCVRLDAARSRQARTGVAGIESLSRAAADVITANQAKAALSPADMGAEQHASARFQEAGDALYAALLGGPPDAAASAEGSRPDGSSGAD